MDMWSLLQGGGHRCDDLHDMVNLVTQRRSSAHASQVKPARLLQLQLSKSSKRTSRHCSLSDFSESQGFGNCGAQFNAVRADSMHPRKKSTLNWRVL